MTADASNTELLFQIIHTINQFSIYGAVSDWSGQLGQSPNETELASEKFMTNEDAENLEMLKSVNLRKKALWETLQGRNVLLETDCERIIRILSLYLNPFKLQSMRAVIILASGGSWCSLQDPSRHG